MICYIREYKFYSVSYSYSRFSWVNHKVSILSEQLVKDWKTKYSWRSQSALTNIISNIG